MTSGAGAVDLRPTPALLMVDLTTNSKLTGLKAHYTVHEGKQLVAREYKLPDGTRDFGLTRLRFDDFVANGVLSLSVGKPDRAGRFAEAVEIVQRVMGGPNVTARLVPDLEAKYGTLPGME